MRGIRLLAVGALIVAPLTLSASSAEAALTPTVPTCGMTITHSVKLTSDLTCSSGPAILIGPETTPIIVDLGGHTITSTDSTAYAIEGLTTIRNGTIRAAYIDHEPSGTMTLQHMVIDGGETSVTFGEIDAYNSTFIHDAALYGSGASIDAEHDVFIGGSSPYTFALGGFQTSVTAVADTISGYDTGVSVWDTDSGVHLSGNHIERNRIGVSTGGGGLTITAGSLSKNIISANSGDGIFLGSGNTLTISGNTLSLNGGDGIHIDTTDSVSYAAIHLTMGGNKALMNAGWGVEVTGTEPTGLTVTDGGGNIAKQNVNGGCSAGIACT